MVSLSAAFAARGRKPEQPTERKRKPVSLRAAFASAVDIRISTDDRDRQQLAQFMRCFGDAAGARMFRRGLTLDQAFAEHDAAVRLQQCQQVMASRRAYGG
jgi:hypothetical protein